MRPLHFLTQIGVWRQSAAAILPLLFLALSLLAGCRPIQPEPSSSPAITATTAQASDHIALLPTESGVTAEIESPSGIGSAILNFAGSPLPSTVTLRLHLQGLESLSIDNGAVTLEIAITSMAPYTTHQTIRPVAAASSQPIDPHDPAWAQVEIVSARGATPQIPVEDGYIDVTLPSGFVNEAQRTLDIRWVDFYR
ncbi:MAG: hypothetical protein H3C34_12115 [Caldilineaceae bacterium]|nr:hypothetical protein [Caldilineaceae bacterium]